MWTNGCGRDQGGQDFRTGEVADFFSPGIGELRRGRGSGPYPVRAGMGEVAEG